MPDLMRREGRHGSLVIDCISRQNRDSGTRKPQRERQNALRHALSS